MGFSTVPANVPISKKTSAPQALTGPKASGLDKQLVSASICCSVQGIDASRRNGTATLQSRRKYSRMNHSLQVPYFHFFIFGVSLKEANQRKAGTHGFSSVHINKWYLRLYGLSFLISEGFKPQIKWPNVATSIAANCSTTSLRLHMTPKIAALIWKMEFVTWMVALLWPEYNEDEDLLRAPIWQRPQMSQCTRISRSRGLKFSLRHLRHQRAQRQDLVCTQLTHWTVGLQWVNNQSTVRERNNDATRMRLVFPRALWRGKQWFLLSLDFKQTELVNQETSYIVPGDQFGLGQGLSWGL